MSKHAKLLASLSLAALPASLALAAPVNYEMNLRTTAGMGAGGGASVLGAMFGGKGGGVHKAMDLRLTNPTDIPADYKAGHTVPEGMRIGPELPLKGERRTGGSGEHEHQESQPDGRVLIYWGCSATVPKGQPEIIDFKALGKQVPPEVMAMARARAGKGGGGGGAKEGTSLPPRTIGWPWHDDSFRGIPAEASSVGEHVIKASFLQQDIRLPLGKELEFLEAMNLKATASDMKKAILLRWDAQPRAKGFDLTAASAIGEKDIVMWSAARNKSPMLPGSQTECTIPEGIFAKAEVASVSAVVHGPSQGYAYPPQKPGEKKPLIWTARVRLTGYESLLLGLQDAAAGSAKEAATESAADAVVPGVGGLLKGIFGR